MGKERRNFVILKKYLCVCLVFFPPTLPFPPYLLDYNLHILSRNFILKCHIKRDLLVLEKFILKIKILLF